VSQRQKPVPSPWAFSTKPCGRPAVSRFRISSLSHFLFLNIASVRTLGGRFKLGISLKFVCGLLLSATVMSGPAPHRSQGPPPPTQQQEPDPRVRPTMRIRIPVRSPMGVDGPTRSFGLRRVSTARSYGGNAPPSPAWLRTAQDPADLTGRPSWVGPPAPRRQPNQTRRGRSLARRRASAAATSSSRPPGSQSHDRGPQDRVARMIVAHRNVTGAVLAAAALATVAPPPPQLCITSFSSLL